MRLERRCVELLLSQVHTWYQVDLLGRKCNVCVASREIDEDCAIRDAIRIEIKRWRHKPQKARADAAKVRGAR